MIGDRKLIGLSRDMAERALADLLAGAPSTDVPAAEPRPNWQIIRGHQIIDCRDENEAKQLARALRRKGAKIAVRLSSDHRILRTIEARDLRAWLSD